MPGSTAVQPNDFCVKRTAASATAHIATPVVVKHAISLINAIPAAPVSLSDGHGKQSPAWYLVLERIQPEHLHSPITVNFECQWVDICPAKHA